MYNCGLYTGNEIINKLIKLYKVVNNGLCNTYLLAYM